MKSNDLQEKLSDNPEKLIANTNFFIKHCYIFGKGTYIPDLYNLPNITITLNNKSVELLHQFKEFNVNFNSSSILYRIISSYIIDTHEHGFSCINELCNSIQKITCQTPTKLLRQKANTDELNNEIKKEKELKPSFNLFHISTYIKNYKKYKSVVYKNDYNYLYNLNIKISNLIQNYRNYDYNIFSYDIENNIIDSITHYFNKNTIDLSISNIEKIKSELKLFKLSHLCSKIDEIKNEKLNLSKNYNSFSKTPDLDLNNISASINVHTKKTIDNSSTAIYVR